MFSTRLAASQISSEPSNIGVASGHYTGWQIRSHEAPESLESDVDYTNFDALAGVPGLVPDGRTMGLDTLTYEIAMVGLGWDDFPHPEHAGLVRELALLGQRNVGSM